MALIPGSRTTVTKLTLEEVSRHPLPEELDDEMFCLGVYQVAGLLERLGVESTSYLQTVRFPCTHGCYPLFPSVRVLLLVLRLPPKEGKGDKPVKVIFGLNKVGCLLYEVVA